MNWYFVCLAVWVVGFITAMALPGGGPFYGDDDVEAFFTPLIIWLIAIFIIGWLPK